ncbi:tRNA (adenosine(37)-N6)-dimethylallyltransferase MiaA [Deinococcus metallilatus]|uniref:tRNA dimethylallyltransferase n=1 Tax=Deinococcus metallilatus TaxID=1211322 RepID=A0AAJ5F2M9_9DEIO|nr:tRNA (adenosine(37)-N6)-dimethylallyltransferase MiaA [Deinococcus metallilatus]MBB5295190.1 tRNA dimethylallyltransferase [Deinococcus metallilatus]QBY08644.1 tRNA (adenosine(37)-N6)-dimethylallyltransferase MiaA [Deinococcus metallilatus]RXJ10523.1 tRNA (adenosine(37)-N6)-dimethylallyltransferase MiaA [Deinococcus metallilatus]TLK26494.1 tRNA (adenosine(37)-N6)-dimethylallyltransferase MiaA [Deinococcus metallilatus]GMA14964.1 tRNA dimethylallyltransferase [Deinococcus metallilatus]
MTRVPILTAPTAAGKSALALDLGRRFGLEVVAADAFTVYRGLDIGTAKPTPAERADVPHHLLDVADVTEDYDVARYVREAEAAIADVLERGALPLVVGGTGFYLSALVRGLPLTPPADPQVRAEVEADLAVRGLDALLAEVEAAHPAEAARLERNPRRVVRALEVYRRTGKFPGEFGYSSPAFRYRVFAFTRPWPELEARIAARTRAMLAEGWPEEAAWLARQVPPDRDPRPTAWQALGYREALAVSTGALTPEAAARQIALTTRQYAKRQLTWARTQLGASPSTPDEAARALAAFLGG